jgi:hypothetical protein
LAEGVGEGARTTRWVMTKTRGPGGMGRKNWMEVVGRELVLVLEGGPSASGKRVSE